MPNKKNKTAEQIKDLQAQNKMLISEVNTLKRELEKVKGKKAVFERKSDASIIAFEKQAVNEELFAKNFYSSYFIKSISKTKGFSIYEKIVNALKGYNFVKFTLQIITVIFALIQSGAIVLFTSVFLVLFSPIAFLASALAFLATHILSGMDNKRNKLLLAGKDVTIFFPPKGKALSKDSFFAGFTTENAEKTNSAVVIVSPYFIKAKGISGIKKFYLFSRKETGNIILVRRHYFFKLRKKVIFPDCGNINMIY